VTGFGRGGNARVYSCEPALCMKKKAEEANL
jgi:hypothetical protein